MLVTFTCHAHENITLFGGVAQRLLTMMGHSGVVPSAILANDVPVALARLQHAIEQEKQRPIQKSSSRDDDDEHDVSLTHRALPLIELLQAAVAEGCDVLWA